MDDAKTVPSNRVLMVLVSVLLTIILTGGSLWADRVTTQLEKLTVLMSQVLIQQERQELSKISITRFLSLKDQVQKQGVDINELRRRHSLPERVE
jgi:hypothetical protein